MGIFNEADVLATENKLTTASGDLVSQMITDHGYLTGKDDDDHTQYIRTDGFRGFTATVSGVEPVLPNDLMTKKYFEDILTGTSSGTEQVGNILFGSEFDYIIDEVESSTNSITYQEKISLSVDVPEGGYRIGWHLEWRLSKQNSQFHYRVQQDNTTNLVERDMSPYVDVNVWNLLTNFYYLGTLSSGTHTFDMDFHTSDVGTTAYIRATRIEFWRVSS